MVELFSRVVACLSYHKVVGRLGLHRNCRRLTVRNERTKGGGFVKTCILIFLMSFACEI